MLLGKGTEPNAVTETTKIGGSCWLPAEMLRQAWVQAAPDSPRVSVRHAAPRRGSVPGGCTSGCRDSVQQKGRAL